MANPAVLRRTAGLIRLLCLAVAVAALSGCAPAHRYPAYRGRVLELGTDRPIEGAGVLAVYRMFLYTPIERFDRYLGYQAVLTDKEGRFAIPAVTRVNLNPLKTFDPRVRITIYKRGYGNFPGSVGGKYVVKMAKQGRTEPELERGQWVPPDAEVTFWLPKLETAEEIREHDLLFSVTSSILDDDYPPRGTTREQFEPVGR